MRYLIAQTGLLSNGIQSTRDNDPGFIGCNRFLLCPASHGARSGYSIWRIIFGPSNKSDKLFMVDGILGIPEFKLRVNLEKNNHAVLCQLLFYSGSSLRTIKCNSSNSPFNQLASGQYAYLG